MSDKQVKKVEISHRTIIFSVLFLIGLWFLYQIREILLALFISVILMGALNPTIKKLENLKIPRWVAILIIYLIILGFLGGALAGLVPALVSQTDSLVNTLLELEGKISLWGITTIDLGARLQELGGLPTQVARIVISFASNLFSVVSILILTFYLLMERQNLDDYLFFLFGTNGQDKAQKLIDRLEERLGGWVRTQFLLMTIIGTLTYVGLKILGYRYALPLAIIAGLLEMIVYVGPILSAILIGVVGLITSPLLAAFGAGWLVIVQQLENNILVPKIMEKSLGVNPLITIIALAVGFQIAGIRGAILSIPVYLTTEVVLTEFLQLKPNNKK
jgi:predicted PurR-regulated permease PerM